MFKAILNLWESCRNPKPDEVPIQVSLLWREAQKNVDALSSGQKTELNKWISIASSANQISDSRKSGVQSNRFYVPVGYGSIMERNDELFTTGLFCCTALAIQTDKHNFLAHINAGTNGTEIYGAITKIITGQQCKIFIWSG